MTATSSAVVERTVAPSAPVGAPAGPATTLPNAPKMTFAIERFIALPIFIVSSVPEAPTSMPLTISTFECSTKPVAAAASPVKAFSNEITTGMSAPPIGSTNMTPNSAATTIIAARPQKLTAAIAQIPSATAQTKMSPLTTCWPGNVIGWPLISSCNFANATIEPANEIEPISAERTVEMPRSTPTLPAIAQTVWNSTSDTSAAAPPPTPLNSATICGIAVIFTLRAPTAPITPPISPPTAMIHQPVTTSSRSSVTTIATAMPAAPTWLPRRAWRGDERNRSARMKHAIGIRYSRFAVFWLTLRVGGLAPLLEHLEHAVGDDEAADDVRAREDHRQQRQQLHEPAVVRCARDDDRADDHDAVNRVRAGHQRRVQQRRYLRDHLEAEEDRQHQDRELGDELGAQAATSCFPATHAPEMISSDQSSFSSPSETSSCTSAVTLRE